MLIPVRMCRMDCLFSRDFRDTLVSSLHSKGVVQIDFIEDETLKENSISRDFPPERVSSIHNLILKARRIADYLNAYGGTKVGFVDDLLDINRNERLVVRERSFENLLEYAEGVVNPAEYSMNILQAKDSGLEIRASELKAQIEKYSPYGGLGLDSEYFKESTFLSSTAGILPTENANTLESELSRKLQNRFLFIRAKQDVENSIIVLSVLNEDSTLLEEILGKNRFNKLSVDIYGRFDEVLESAQDELKKISSEKSEIENSIKKFNQDYLSKILAVIELLEIELQRCDIFTSCGATKNVTFMRLWSTEKDSKNVEEIIRKTTENHCVIKKTIDLDDAPILLGNPSYLKPFEGLIKMFSTPKYNQLDPTFLLAPTFVLFFGMMFSDVIYGLLLISLALLLYKRYNPYSSSVKDMSIILTYFGLSAAFFGLLSGSFLGDFVGKYVLGLENGSQSIALWLDPLYNGNIIKYLYVVFTIGFLHILLGYATGAIDALRRKQYKTALLDYMTLIVLPFGIISYYAFDFQAGLLVSALSLILIFIGSGIMGLYLKVSGMLGSVISYARLLALMTSSSGISMTVNFMAYLSLSIPYVGLILAPFIFIGGHCVNLALNMLGSFVHTLRLHYVEFFGTFYEGGGVEFTPFVANRRYSKLVKEEVK